MSSVDEFTRVSHVILDAIVTRNARTLDACLADDFVSLAPGGGRQRKHEFIQAITEAAFDVTSASFEGLEIETFGDVAVVVGIQRAEVRLPSGVQVTSRAAFTDVFVRQGGGWRLRVAQATDLP